ncbi:MAG: DAHL domain-containing protein [Cyanobacteria bacterium J06649_4]
MTTFFRWVAARCHRLFRIRVVSVVAGVLILIFLTGLFQQTQLLKRSHHYQIISQLRALDRTNIIVVADALKIRLTLLPNYDAAVANGQFFQTQLIALEQTLSALSPAAENLQQRLRSLETQAANRALLIEDLKSENAVLQNSASYLPQAIETFAARLPNDAPNYQQQTYQQKALLNQLMSALSQYTVEADESTAVEIEQLMSQLEASSPNIQLSTQPNTQLDARPENGALTEQTTVENIGSHVRAVLYRKLQVNDAINRIVEAPVGDAIEQLALGYEAYHRKITQIQRRYQWALYLSTLLLLVGSGYLIWNYRSTVHLQKINVELGDLVSERTQALNQTLKTLKSSQSQLVQAEKMSALGQLSAGIAHEINNPINFIYGNVQASEHYSQDCIKLIDLYAERYPNPSEDIEDLLESMELDFLREDWSKLFESMKTGTSRVKKIVESLRNFSRLDESDCKTVDLHEGIESTLLLLSHRLRASDRLPEIKIVKNYQTLPQISCQPSAINQVFMNILTNAIDAFDAGQRDPTITISTSVSSIEETPAQTIVTIADNGSGMTEAIKAKIFDPFFTSKPVGKGTGLGLSVSYQTIVEGHSGQLAVTSSLGEGSSFQIRLPVGLPTNNGPADEGRLMSKAVL